MPVVSARVGTFDVEAIRVFKLSTLPLSIAQKADTDANNKDKVKWIFNFKRIRLLNSCMPSFVRDTRYFCSAFFD